MSAIVLTDGVTSIELPGGLDWADRRAWSPLRQTRTLGLTGKPIVQVAALVGGRPITLRGGADRAFVTTSVCDALQAWADSLGQLMTVTIDGTAYPVIWRHHDAPALEAVPVFGISNPPPEWPHIVTLKFETRTL